MKKLISFLVIASIIAACDKAPEPEPVDPSNPSGQTDPEDDPNQTDDPGQTDDPDPIVEPEKNDLLSINAVLEQFATKTVTGLDNVTNWVTGDVITITDNLNGTSYEYRVKEGGSATAEFEPVDKSMAIHSGQQSYDLYAVYNGAASSEQVNNGGRTSSAPLSASFSGAAQDNGITLSFNQDASLISFSFVDASNSGAELKLSKLVIVNLGGEEIASGSTSITVTPSVDASSTCQTVVSKSLLSSALLIKATIAEPAASAEDGTTFPAGTEFCRIFKHDPMDLRDAAHATLTVPLNQQGIGSKDDLLSFGYMVENELSISNYIGGTYTNGGHETPEVSILADIDMGGNATEPIEWNPIGGGEESNSMRWYFNGRNHNIYNFNVATDESYFGLFGDVYDVTYWGGQIANLNLGTRDGSTWDGVSRITLKSDGKGDHFIGTFIGRVKKNSKGNGNWQMLNCKNFVPIDISSDNWDKAYVGGFMGNASRVLFKNCMNYGDITNNSSKFGICIGGFAGFVGDKLTQKFEGCENHGNITVNDKGTEYVGGLVGRYTPGDPDKNNVNSFNDCRNYGAISVNAVSTVIHVGGLVGDVIANGTYPASFAECVNEGAIVVKCNGKLSTADLISTGGIVGRGEAPVDYATCSNKGNVKIEIDGETTKAGARAGGIFGDNNAAKDGVVNDSNCTECTNSGAIELQFIYTAAAVSTENYCLGGIAGRINSSDGEGQEGSVIKDCINDGGIYIKANRATMGGIVGAIAGGSLIGCSNRNKVEYHYQKSVSSYVVVGGIAGDVWGSAKELTNCVNEGEVYSRSLTKNQERANYIGGIVGWLEDDCMSTVVSGCENKGAVTGNAHTNNDNTVPFAGGIIGYKESKTTDHDNINRGSVMASGCAGRAAAAGGVVGAIHFGTVKSCWNYGSVEAGEKAGQYDLVNASWSKGYAGSIAGWYGSSAEGKYPACEGTITGCHAGGSVQGKNSGGVKVALTSSNFSGYIAGKGTLPSDCSFSGN